MCVGGAYDLFACTSQRTSLHDMHLPPTYAPPTPCTSLPPCLHLPPAPPACTSQAMILPAYAPPTHLATIVQEVRRPHHGQAQRMGRCRGRQDQS